MDGSKLFDGTTHFIWDEHNQHKSLVKHRVSTKECEQVFLDPQIEFANESVQESSGGR